MRILKRKTLKDFWEIYTDAEQQLKSWIYNVENSIWKSPNDVKKIYNSASFLPNNRIVFNIKGNNYRLIAKVNYDLGIVFIKYINTHKEYDKIDANTIDNY